MQLAKTDVDETFPHCNVDENDHKLNMFQAREEKYVRLVSKRT